MCAKAIPEYISIGSIGKTKGLSGELILFLDEIFEDVLQSSEFIFYHNDGQKIPLFIEYWEENGADYLIKFEEIDSPEVAVTLSGLPLYQRKDILKNNGVSEHELEYLHKSSNGLVGFTIMDPLLEKPAIISEIIDRPQQLLAIISIDNVEKMIPLDDALIDRIDEKEKMIYMNLPDGILNL